MSEDLTTENLRLRIPSIDDTAFIFRLRSDPGANLYLKNYIHRSEQETKAFLDKIITGINDQYWEYWIIETKIDSIPIGTICIWNFSPERDRAETGFALMPEFEGKGIMSEALGRVLVYARDQLHLRSMDAWTHPENEKSIRLLSRFGFGPNMDAKPAEGSVETPFTRML